MLILLGLWAFSAIAWYGVRDSLPPGFLALAVKAALWLVPAAIYARRRESLLDAFALRGPARAGLGRALLVGAVYLGAVVALGFLLGQPPSLALPPAVPLALLVINAAVEEAAFRGFLLLHLARGRRFWQANAIAGLLFVAVHVPSFIAAGAAAAIPLSILFVFALALGEATRATRSIWIAVAIHALNNLLAA